MFLHEHLKEGSYVLVYADTDSIGIATTKTAEGVNGSRYDRMKAIFFPIVREDKKEDFLKQWTNWFVLDNTVEQLRCPGLLKGT